MEMLWFWLLALLFASAAGVWIVRPLIARADGAQRAPARKLALAVLGLVPLVALGFYLAVGRPDLATGVLMKAQRAYREDVALVDELKKKVASRPDDIVGHRLLATSLSKLRRYREAVPEYQRVIALGERTPDMLTGLGEALTLSENKTVPEAMTAFDQALAIDPTHLEALYYRAAGHFAQGDVERAVADWTALADAAPADSPAALAAHRNIEVARRVAQERTEQNVAIENMVAGLAARLAAEPKEGPHDLEGWIKLVRSYAVLGEGEKAAAARDTAKGYFTGDASAQERLDAAAR